MDTCIEAWRGFIAVGKFTTSALQNTSGMNLKNLMSHAVHSFRMEETN